MTVKLSELVGQCRPTHQVSYIDVGSAFVVVGAEKRNVWLRTGRSPGGRKIEVFCLYGPDRNKRTDFEPSTLVYAATIEGTWRYTD